MDKLSVVSLNARELKNKMKRTALYVLFKTKEIHLVSLQETYVTARDIVVWEIQWAQSNNL